MTRTARGHSRAAVQSAHIVPTPRVGGVAIGLSLIVSLLFAPPSMLDHYIPFIVSLVPVFLAGLADDLGFDVKPKWRLLAAMLSSAMVILFLNIWMPRVDVPYLDTLIAVAPVGIVLTLLVTAGISNAFNLIDGLNGLSAGTGAIAAVGIAQIANAAGYDSFLPLSGLVVAALAGFLLLNFPLGKLFLGDAGAYTLGHVLSWFAILVVVRMPDVSTWALLLVFFWPIADMLFSMLRRAINGKRIDQPDRLHYHQLVMRGLEIRWLGRGKRQIANPLATVILMPFIAMPAVTGVVLWNQPLMSFLAVLAYACLFWGTYNVGIEWLRRRP